MSTIRAIFENGVFRPVAPVELPEACEVEFDPKVVTKNGDRATALKRAREILSRRYDSGETDVAERHNEHQP